VEPDQSGATEALFQKWNTYEGGYGITFGIRSYEGGRTIDILCGSNSSSRTTSKISDRTKKNGQYEERVVGPFEQIEFERQDNTDGYPGPILETAIGDPGRQNVRFYFGPSGYGFDIHVRSTIDGVAIDCRSNEDSNRTPQLASRIEYGSRCWEYPVGNSIFPCPTP
jgi:hypothetical protein